MMHAFRGKRCRRFPIEEVGLARILMSPQNCASVR
jgi:hypothetical protein